MKKYNCTLLILLHAVGPLFSLVLLFCYCFLVIPYWQHIRSNIFQYCVDSIPRVLGKVSIHAQDTYILLGILKYF